MCLLSSLCRLFRSPVWRPGPALACALAIAVSGPGFAGCSTDDTGGALDPIITTTGQINVTITSPKAGDSAIVVSGVVHVVGKIALDKGVALNKAKTLSVTLGEAPAVVCPIAGNAFDCAVDTAVRDAASHPIFGCNDPKTLLVFVTGTYSGSETSGSAALDVEVDNCPPSLVIDSPAEGAMFAGEQVIHVSVSDPQLRSASLDVLDDAGNSVLTPPGPVKLASPNPVWSQGYTLDMSRSGVSQNLTIHLVGQDDSPNPTELTRTIRSIKRPSFLGNAGDGDVFRSEAGLGAPPGAPQGHVNDFAVASIDNAPDGFVGFTADPTPVSGLDSLADVVVAATDGVYVRAGIARRDTAGALIDKNGALLHTRHFENPVFPDKLAKYRAIHGSVGGANMSRVFLRDLDHDGDLDIVAVGAVAGVGTAWAILNVPALIKRDDADPGFTMRAFKLVEVRELPAIPGSAEMADLDKPNADGVTQDDLVLGAPSVGIGLMSLLLEPVPQCKVAVVTPDGSTTTAFKPCDDSISYDALLGATVFATSVDVATHPGVTGISAIALADFFTGGGIDACVGEVGRPIVSCYRNLQQNGRFEQAQDAYQFLDGNDTHVVRVADLTAQDKTDGPDLIVSSATGEFLRWLKGDHGGKFTYLEGKDSKGVPQVPHSVPGMGVDEFEIENVGPDGQPYVIAAVGREATLIPVDPTDDSYVRACFRAWIMGNRINRIDTAKIDEDAQLDLLTADDFGVQIAYGVPGNKAQKMPNNFIAPDAHHVCARHLAIHSRGIEELDAMQLADFVKDSKPELLIVGKESESEQAPSQADGNAATAYCIDAKSGAATPMPVWPMALFMNEFGQLNPEGRQTEFSPYHPNHAATAGVKTPCKGLGRVKAAVATDVTGDDVPDLVVTRANLEYDVGVPKPPLNGCACPFVEDNETSNSFGVDGPSGTDADLSHCCMNFADSDTNKETPLVGFGNGAPLARATAFVFVSPSATLPLGMAASCNALPASKGGAGICHSAPAFAFAAGRRVVDLAVVDIDGDKRKDIITAMTNDGSGCFAEDVSPHNSPTFKSRVRIFQNKSTGVKSVIFAPSPVQVKAERDLMILPMCGHPEALAKVDVGYRIMPDGLSALSVGPWANAGTGISDVVGLFGLGYDHGQIGVIPHLDKFKFSALTPFPYGELSDAFAVRDVDNDKLADVLVLQGKTLTILSGKYLDPANKTAGFYTQSSFELAAGGENKFMSVDIGDVNGDGDMDILLLAPGSDSVQLFLGASKKPTDPGARFLRYPWPLLAAGDVRQVELLDMDNDKCPEIIVRSKYTASVFHNEGAGWTQESGGKTLDCTASWLASHSPP